MVSDILELYQVINLWELLLMRVETYPGTQDAIKRISVMEEGGGIFHPPATSIYSSYLQSQVLLPNANSDTFQRLFQDLLPLSSIPLYF